ncbi:methyltransferase type 11 [Rhodoblastus sphagnicola]|uniref:Methyltransferase type 11 n=1 Tax=Rhodoblastus sphagnicola TaxID=333368 RepID=A0A2S6N9L7_9HYPH|nr:class I SAM-dependent methyltransferase [Rhodoblastus sphagnicola]MBB4200445.1 SAM-dependent methyltransferase [Rhodoblastus sphagnicola]PPQ31316.1 methyltransferase type 11 [Rhodoblastus sphagnicola]
MALDVTDLRGFYASSLGKTANHLVCAHLARRWDNLAGLSVLGLGYATPYLDRFRGQALRLLAMMPAEQGVVNWPSEGASASALIDDTMLPLPDSCIDRVLLAHALETAEHPRELLEEVWRVLTPGGRLIVVAPNRSGLWARLDSTPFGHGRPFSRGQLHDLMRETLFSPIYWSEALYTPPLNRAMVLRLAPAIEGVSAKLSLPGAGVIVVEATKQLYRLVGARRARRSFPELAPALTPSLSPRPLGSGRDLR